jgi:predicted aspartyl protease
VRHRAIAVAAVCLSVFLSPAAQAEDPPACKLTRAAFLDMTLDQAGRPVIPVSINGAKLSFVVDTAGIYTGVRQNTVDALKLRTASLRNGFLRTGDGEKIDTMAYADELLVGRLPIKDMAFMVWPASHNANDSDGTLAGEFLHLFDVELDFAAAKFSLFLQNDCGPKVVHWTHEPHGELPFEMNKPPMDSQNYIFYKPADWHIIAHAKLDGVDIDATIDTGASGAFMTVEDALDALPYGTDEKSLKRLGGGGDSEHAVFTYPFKTLEFGDIKIENPQIIMQHNADSGAARRFQSRPQLVLGTSILRQLHIYISYKDKKIYFTNATAH